MKALKCEMCGSNDVVKQDGLYVCQNCGTKYTVEEARKMMIEGTVSVEGTIRIDTSTELKNLYEIARRAKDSDNNEQAAKYYDQILVIEPSSWEANFYVVYFRAATSKIDDVCSACTSLTHYLDPVFSMLKEQVINHDEQKRIVSEMLSKCWDLSGKLHIVIFRHYLDDKDTIEYTKRMASITDIMYSFGDIIEEKFGEMFCHVAVDAWEYGIALHNQYKAESLYKNKEKQVILNYAEKIRKYNESYELPKNSVFAGCYIATAVYGSYNCPEVWTLRRFRDNTLDETWYGRAFIKTYYAISPTLVRWFGETSWFRKLWRKPLDKLVASLRNKGVESTPYIDKY